MTAPLLTIRFPFLSGYLLLPFNALELKLAKFKHLFPENWSRTALPSPSYTHEKNMLFTKLPLDILIFAELKYIVICTPGKDVFHSIPIISRSAFSVKSIPVIVNNTTIPVTVPMCLPIPFEISMICHDITLAIKIRLTVSVSIVTIALACMLYKTISTK